MRMIEVREFKDLTPAEQEKAREVCIDSEVEFSLDCLNSELNKGEITEEVFWEAIGCSKYYGESTPWFVGSVYYEHHKEAIDHAVKAILEEAAFEGSGKRLFGV